jgi:hypothetical protein
MEIKPVFDGFGNGSPVPPGGLQIAPVHLPID